MGNPTRSQFFIDAEKIAHDLSHRKTIQFNMGKYHAAVNFGKSRYLNLKKTRDRAAQIKKEALQSLPDYLELFEKNHTANGGTVLWARTADDAIAQIIDILQEHDVSSVVKSKSMTTEEIEINEHLEKNNIESIETDLGEYIVQLAGEKPYHIVTPAMHKSKKDIAHLFHEKFNTSKQLTAEELTSVAREKLRQKFVDAGAGITGANFILPDIGGIAVTENEGNAIMSTSFPKIHIVIAGIEKVIPSYKDLALFWPHLAQHGTGQAITVYNSIFTGPKKETEAHGPEKMYVILLDNGRTNVYSQTDIDVSLTCIRCGACLNVCPVYTNIGGYTYNTTYQGPIGTVITPHLRDFDSYVHLNSACSVCGRCTEVCPVKIPLHELILKNRQLAVSGKKVSFFEKNLMSLFTYAASNSSRMDMVSGNLKNSFFSLSGNRVWGDKRTFPKFSKKSFRSLFLKKNRKK
ncbi:MAG: lactate utilization protein B [Bacteroidales bacterium]|jgi:L-lactate dehydrogenase complex protein LldF|nr:lactate utilization protein B [Bacteroidales bacterium]